MTHPVAKQGVSVPPPPAGHALVEQGPLQPGDLVWNTGKTAWAPAVPFLPGDIVTHYYAVARRIPANPNASMPATPNRIEPKIPAGYARIEQGLVKAGDLFWLEPHAAWYPIRSEPPCLEVSSYHTVARRTSATATDPVKLPIDYVQVDQGKIQAGDLYWFAPDATWYSAEYLPEMLDVSHYHTVARRAAKAESSPTPPAAPPQDAAAQEIEALLEVRMHTEPIIGVRGRVYAHVPGNGPTCIATATLCSHRPPIVETEFIQCETMDEVEMLARVLAAFAARVRELDKDGYGA